MDEKIVISKVSYEKEDEKLLERIFKFKKGAHRIIIFMIVGMIVGWYSNTYTSDSFIVTKVIFAIPYKISEAIYVSIIGVGTTENTMMLLGMNEFFCQSYLATFLAERITPVLIGMGLFGSLAYFTGDKRVFTMERFVKFVGIQSVVLVVFIGSVYVINAKEVADNNALKGVENFYFENPSCGETILGENAVKVKRAFETELKKDSDSTRDEKNEIRIGIRYSGGRAMEAEVNTKEQYLITENGTKYHISQEFAGYVQEYYDTGTIDGHQTIWIGE